MSFVLVKIVSDVRIKSINLSLSLSKNNLRTNRNTHIVISQLPVVMDR